MYLKLSNWPSIRSSYSVLTLFRAFVGPALNILLVGLQTHPSHDYLEQTANDFAFVGLSYSYSCLLFLSLV